MKLFVHRFILITILFSFSLTILKMSSFAFLDLNEDSLEEVLEFAENDSADDFYTFEMIDFYCNQYAEPDFSYYNNSSLNKVCSLKYSEPTLDNPFSPPELIS